MKDLLERIACALVDKPEEVTVTALGAVSAKERKRVVLEIVE